MAAADGSRSGGCACLGDPLHGQRVECDVACSKTAARAGGSTHYTAVHTHARAAQPALAAAGVDDVNNIINGDGGF